MYGKLVADAGLSDIFVLVDAVGTATVTRAMACLRRLLEGQSRAAFSACWCGSSGCC
jgi:hypothetical protein